MIFKDYDFKSKNIVLSFYSMLIGGILFFLPILALYYEESLFNVTNVAIIFAIEAIGFAIFEIPTGAIADLFGRKKTLILANLTSLFALGFLYVGGSMLMFILYAFINSFARSLSSGTDTALIYDTLKEEKKGHLYKRIIGIFYAAWPIGATIGSIIGGYLAKVTLSLPVLITFIPLVIATTLTLFLKEPKYQKETNKNIFKHIFRSLKVIISNKQLLILILGGFILLAFGEITHYLKPLFFNFKQISIEHFGWITAIIFGFSSLGHYLSHNISEKFGNKITLIFAIVASPILLVTATFLPKYFAITLFIIPSFFFGLRNPIINHMLNLEVSSSKRATVISTASFFGQLGVAIFAPLVGYFADIYNINIAFRISAILMLIVPLLYLLLEDRK